MREIESATMPYKKRDKIDVIQSKLDIVIFIQYGKIPKFET